MGSSNNAIKIMENLNLVKFNPAGIQRVALDVLDEYLNGEADLVDPTNPFIFLLESSAVNTAFAINENIVNLRKQYPSLSQTEDELYLHMSDKDYIGRFGTPGFCEFTFMVNYEDIKNKMVYDTQEKCYKAVVPRNTEVKINDVIFSMYYPIVFRKYDNGVVQVAYDTDIQDPVEVLSSNIIKYTVRRDSNGVQWMFFNVVLKQYFISSYQFSIQQTSNFIENIDYTDIYYYCRVYTRSSLTSNKWIEIKTTHTDQVFDPFIPTASLKVYSNILQVTIPLIYITSGLVDGEVRVDVFQTKGDISINLGNNKISNFETQLKAIDEERDLSDYTNAMNNLTYVIFSTQSLNNGVNNISFNKLRDRVINNSAGDRQIPITNNQIVSYVENKGFDLIANIDVVTNRTFLATKRLPKPSNTKLLTSANIGIGIITTNLDTLKTFTTVGNNDNSITLLSNNLYESVNGIISILNPVDVNTIKSLPLSNKVNILNSRKFLYTPFYYVLDNSQREFEVRVYHLDNPKTGMTSFINQNETLQLTVNTAYTELFKVTTGYKLRIVTSSEEFYKSTVDSLINCQLAVKPYGENIYAFINGVLVGKTETNERIFEFDIQTNYNIDSDNNITITNFKMFSDNSINIKCPLSGEFRLFHTTSSVTVNFKADETDNLIAKYLLPQGSVGNTHENIQYDLGTSLKSLWVRSKSHLTGNNYKTYEQDQPLVYTKDVYATDPTTGSIFTIDSSGNIVYNILHKVNDPVLNNDGQQVYKHRKGDVVLDSSGSPIIDDGLRVDRELDLLFIDGKYYFADDESFVNYRKEISNTISDWINKDLSTLQDILLEKTKIYFYPKSSISIIPVVADGIDNITIEAEQEMIVDFYVKSKIFKDNDIRTIINDGVIGVIDEYIQKPTVNISEISDVLKKNYSDVADGIRVSGISTKQYQVVSIKNNYDRLSLKKKIVSQSDGKMYIKEAVTVNFINIEI